MQIITIDMAAILYSNGAPSTNRTCDPLLRRKVLYPLSYGGVAASFYALYGRLTTQESCCRMRQLCNVNFAMSTLQCHCAVA